MVRILSTPASSGCSRGGHEPRKSERLPLRCQCKPRESDANSKGGAEANYRLMQSLWRLGRKRELFHVAKTLGDAGLCEKRSPQLLRCLSGCTWFSGEPSFLGLLL